MTDPSVYPFPLPLAPNDAIALVQNPGQWADVPGAFIAFEMLPLDARDGEWRYAGAAKSLAGIFEKLVEFGMAAYGLEDAAARNSLAELIHSWAIAAFPRLEDGHSGITIRERVSAARRVVCFYEAQAPHENHGLCILELEPADAAPFFARPPETHPVPTWDEMVQQEQQRDAEDDES